jgi:hypothetical protein
MGFAGTLSAGKKRLTETAEKSQKNKSGDHVLVARFVLLEKRRIYFTVNSARIPWV